MEVIYDKVISVCIQDSVLYKIRSIIKQHGYKSISEFFRVAVINEMKRLGYTIDSD